MIVTTEYRAINIKHDDLKRVQLEHQRDSINVAVLDGEKLFCRTWM